MTSCGHSTLPPFPWTRFWRVEEAGTSVDASDQVDGEGFLYDPAAWSHLGLKPQHRAECTLAELLSKSVVVLKGRPGAGKTTEIERAITEGLFNIGGLAPIVRRAKSLSSNESFVRGIFDQDDWRASKGQPVCLVVDGVDELLQRDAGFLQQFTDAMKLQLVDRGLDAIRLVLTCRAAEWIDTSLLSLWGSHERATATLCPLTRKDAMEFVADQLKGDAAQFWEQVSAKRILTLAPWPQSLKLLVDEFRYHDAQLPGTHFALIRSAARRLCDIHSDSERRKRLKTNDPTFDLDWMFRVVSRVAALSVFTGKSSVSTEDAPVHPHVLALCDWQAGAEPWTQGQAKAITQEDVDRLNRTQIFDSEGQTLLQFNHQLFREHLAAAWLADRQLTIPQLDRLFGRRASDHWRHYPQLATIAAWLANDPSQKEWRAFLVREDPTVLLRADATGLPVDEKRDIVRSLLNRAKQDQAIDHGIEHHVFQGLAFDGLDKELAPFLEDFTGEGEASRLLALNIATAAKVTSLAPTLWRLFRMTTISLRVQIARTLHVIAQEGEANEREWRAVIDEEITPDDQGHIVGAALEILVPNRLKVRDVLHWVIPRRSFDINYTTADLADKLEPADVLPILERSIAHHGVGLASVSSSRRSIVSAALSLLADQLDNPKAMRCFVRWWWAATFGHYRTPTWDRGAVNDSQPSLNQLGFADPLRRRAFLDAVVNEPFAQTMDAYSAMMFERLIIPEEDTEWLLRQLDAASASVKHIWARWMRDLYFNDDLRHQHREALEIAFAKNEALRKQLPTPADGLGIFEHIDQARAERIKNPPVILEEDAEEKQRARLTKRVEAFMAKAKQLATKKDPQAWPTLTSAFIERSGYNWEVPVNAALQSCEPWMLDAARYYLMQPPDPFPGHIEKLKSSIRIDGTLAFRALWCELEPDSILGRTVAEHWLPYILCHLQRASTQSDDINLAAVINRFGDKGMDAFMRYAEFEYDDEGSLPVGKALVDCWTPRATAALAKILVSHPPKPFGFSYALRFLYERDREAAVQMAAHWLDQAPDQISKDERITLLGAITVYLGGRLWDRVKLIIGHNTELAAAVMRAGPVRLGLNIDERITDLWPDDHLSEIAEMMLRTFHPDQGPPHRAGRVEERSESQMVRDQLIHMLGQRGLTQAVHRLQSLGFRGTKRWFSIIENESRKVALAKAWRPLTCGEMLAIAKEHELALAVTNDDLMTTVINALKRYERELHHPTRTTFDIWKTSFIDSEHEERISDDLRKWLDEKLHLATSREAEVRSQTVGYTDIEISMTRPPHALLHLTIEVKRDAHVDLMQSMEVQLRDRYLVNGRTHGLYLVCWFSDGDAPNHSGISTIEQMQAYLDTQAARLSINDYQLQALVIDCRPRDNAINSRSKKAPQKRNSASRRSKNGGH